MTPAIKLARECGIAVSTIYGGCDNARLERFYAKAQAQALRDAADKFMADKRYFFALLLNRMADELERKE